MRKQIIICLCRTFSVLFITQNAMFLKCDPCLRNEGTLKLARIHLTMRFHLTAVPLFYIIAFPIVSMFYMSNFTNCNIFFSSEGSNLTPAHHFPDFRLKSYAPLAFRYFRELFGIKADDYLVSLQIQAIHLICSNSIMIQWRLRDFKHLANLK